MAQGKKKCDPPAHGNHMHHFDEAMEDALDNWHGSSDANMKVTFEATVSPNPGGIKEYRVTISDS